MKFYIFIFICEILRNNRKEGRNSLVLIEHYNIYVFFWFALDIYKRKNEIVASFNLERKFQKEFGNGVFFFFILQIK